MRLSFRKSEEELSPIIVHTRLLRTTFREEGVFLMHQPETSGLGGRNGANPRGTAVQDARPVNAVQPPRHYHLLWDEELDALQPILTMVSEHLAEVVDRWYQLYILHFGDTRSLAEAEFRDLFYNALLRNTKDLLVGDMDRYAVDTIHTGELLCERKVPFAEVVASLHSYEQSAYTVFPKNPPPPLEIYAAFDKLSHIRMILLADAYFRSASASTGARIHALERQATLVAREKRSTFHGLVGSSPAMRRL